MKHKMTPHLQAMLKFYIMLHFFYFIFILSFSSLLTTSPFLSPSLAFFHVSAHLTYATKSNQKPTSPCLSHTHLS